MDLSKLEASNVKHDVRHPGTNAETGFIVELSSVYAPAFKKVQRRIADRLSKLRAKGKGFSGEEIEQNRRELVGAAIVGWEFTGNSNWGGNILPFTPVNVKTILEQDWLLEQLDESLGDVSTFFRD